MSIKTYAILKDGKCINKVLWDGVAEWNPPEGTTAVCDENNEYSIETEEAPNTNSILSTEDFISSLTPEQKQALLNLLDNQT